MTPGARAYAEYFGTRQGLNSEGKALPQWDELPAEIRGWWESAAIRPPGSPPAWKSPLVWFNLAVLILASIESQMETLKGLLPGHIFVWVAFGLPLANAAVRAYRVMAAAMPPSQQGVQ